MTTDTNIVNDGFVVGTNIVESTPIGDIASAVILKNDGTLILGNSTHTGSISSDNGKFTTDGSGNITMQNTTLPSITANGNVTFNGSISGLSLKNIINTFVVNSVLLTSSPTTVSHSLGSIPSMILITQYSGTLTNGFSITNITSTTFQVSYGGGSININYIAFL